MQGIFTLHAYLHLYLRFVVAAEIRGLGKEIFLQTGDRFSKAKAKTNSLQL
jgi:hypothetical protein